MLTPGDTYFVKLYFSENQFNATGERIISILVNGVPVSVNLDVLAAAGGEHVSTPPPSYSGAACAAMVLMLCTMSQEPFSVSFSAKAPFDIQIVGNTGNAILSGIEVYKAYDPPAAPLPPFMATNLVSLRVNCAGPMIATPYWTNDCASLFTGIGK
jgi:Malectin domain